MYLLKGVKKTERPSGICISIGLLDNMYNLCITI